MFLKRIEIEGFKSFADRTVFPVERGLTGIVGPNGCGKSNVVDALLWVLGERSAKALRAAEMADVIFSGADGRQQAAYAAVEIVITDEEGQVVEAGGELAIGRRLFRTGESEYRISGRKVRRKDVRDLLMDTGLGVRGYMVLAQGKIDAVLAADPKDRRTIFEEAAGISRYRLRKHETLRRLQQVAQDLERVDDVLREVERQVRSLKAQAGRAQRWLEVRDRYRDLRVRVAIADRALLLDARQKQELLSQGLEERLEALKTDRTSAEDRLRAMEQEESLLRERHDSARKSASEVRERGSSLEERVRGLEERSREMLAAAERERERLGALTEEKSEAQSLGEGVGAQLAELQETLPQLLETESRARASYDEVRQRRATHRELEESTRRAVLDAIAERTRFQNATAEAARHAAAATGSFKSMLRRKEEATMEQARWLEEKQRFAGALQQASEAVAEQEGAAAGLLERREAARTRIATAVEGLRAAQQRLEQAKARREALETLERDQYGLPERVRELLGAGHEGVEGLVLDGVEVPSPWDRIVEALLGEGQSAVWVADADRLDTVRDAGALEIHFPAADRPLQTAPAGTQPLLSVLVGPADRCRALARRIGAAFLCADAKQAAALAAQYDGALFLAPEGEVHASGWARLGIRDEEEASGLLQRRNELLRTGAAEEAATKAADRYHREEAAAQADLRAIEADLSGLDERLRGAVKKRDQAATALDEADRRVQAANTELEATTSDASRLHEEESRFAVEQQRADEQLGEAEEAHSRASAQLQRLVDQGESVEATWESARSTLQDSSSARQAAEERAGQLQERIAEQERRSERSLEESGRAELHLAELEEKQTAILAEIETARAELRDVLNQRCGAEELVATAEEHLADATRALNDSRVRQEAFGDELERLLAQRQEQALADQKLALDREDLERSIQEEFGQALDSIADSLDLDGEAVDASVRDELSQARKKIESIGNVNLEAVDELEKRQERHAFLKQERDDLLAASRSLTETLETIDKECRARFLDTFTRVRDEFQDTFRRLFRGGKADLSLPEGEDPLDCGIEIMARPPGKELKSIMLLSGGEKTMTAIALLLAVFRSRPSPFCLLDEVDAALDDSNVDLFLDLLDSYTDETQFMVVTHNRITMSRCERLYGVTMPKAGVSQTVSVTLDELPADPAPEAERSASNVPKTAGTVPATATQDRGGSAGMAGAAGA